MHLSEMRKFPGTFIGAALGIVIGVYLVMTAPPREQNFVSTAVPRAAVAPIASILDPVCANNTQEMYMVEPKLFQNITLDTLLVKGQATGTRLPIVVELRDTVERLLQQTEAMVAKGYPCDFESAFSVTGLPSGMYTIRASYAPEKNTKSVPPVSVTVKIGK